MTDMKQYASTPMTSVEKMYPPKTMGIISLITDNGTPVKSKYGTFPQFVRMAKARIQNGYIMSVAWCPSHDGYEIDFDNGKQRGWNDYIEDWVRFYGIGRQRYGIEFHTIVHRKHYRESKNKIRTVKRYVKPTKNNDTEFIRYQNILKRGW